MCVFCAPRTTAVLPRGCCWGTCDEMARRVRPVLSPLYLLCPRSDNRLICSSSWSFQRFVPVVIKSVFEVWARWSSDDITVSFSVFSDAHCHAIICCHAKSQFLILVSFFVCARHPGSHTHTHIQRRHSHAHHDNVFTSSSRRSSHFGWFTGALITLCLLALVNTMTTWQRLNIWNTVIISPSSKKTQSVILIAGSWLSALTEATPVCHLPGRHGKKATQKKKCSGWESHFWAAAQYLTGSVAVCMFCLIVKELIIQYFSKWWKCCQGKWRRH